MILNSHSRQLRRGEDLYAEDKLTLLGKTFVVTFTMRDVLTNVSEYYPVKSRQTHDMTMF